MPSIKGTASISSTHALSKLLRTTNFPSHFSTPVDISKLHRNVFTHWIETRITELLGFEDEIVGDTAVNLFLPEHAEGDKVEVDPRKGQLDLVGFLGEKESAEFASELWSMMIDASQRKSGIPLVLVEKKKEEMKKARDQQTGGNNRGQGVRRGIAGGPQGGEMNAFVREAARRAEMARAALNDRRGPDAQPDRHAIPPSPRQSKELHTIDRAGENYQRRELDEFGRQRGRNDSHRSKPSSTGSRYRSPSNSRSRSPSSRSSSSEERRYRRRDDGRRSKRSRSRSNSSEDMRRRRRDGKHRR